MTVTVGEAKDDLAILESLIKKAVEDYQNKNTHVIVTGYISNISIETKREEMCHAVEVILNASIPLR
jgi:hypothetical protein